MYLKTITEVRRAVAERLARTGEIRLLTDRFAKRYCGIDDYMAKVEKHLPFLPGFSGRPFGILARQIASCNVEEVVCQMACLAMEVLPVTLTFTRDSFTSENHDKRARLYVPWIWRSPKGKLVVNTTYIGDKDMGQFERRPLDKIGTNLGLPLPMFHSLIRRVAFGSTNGVYDVSKLHNETLVDAVRRPTEAYQCEKGRDQKVSVSGLSSFDGVRPPASWYYPLYLSWFLDGRMVLLETYDNPESAVPRAKILFEETMTAIERETGLKPLVAQIPPLSSRMLYCNRHLLERPFSFEGLGEIGQDEFLPTALERVADEVINYR